MVFTTTHLGVPRALAKHVPPDDSLAILDTKLRLRNERLMCKLLAWAELLDAAGWCVALNQPGEGTFWLGNQAKQYLQSLDCMPLNWNDLTVVLSRTPESSIHRKGEGLLIWSWPSDAPKQIQPEVNLTRREAEIMQWLKDGKTGPEIAIILGCAVRTVEKHLANLYRKLGVRDRSAAIFKIRNH